MLRLEAPPLVLPPEEGEDDELEDVAADVLLPGRDATSYPPFTPDLFPADFFANNSVCVSQIMNTDEIIVTATKILIILVHAPILLLFIKELLY
jgi:hypothetical protein